MSTVQRRAPEVYRFRPLAVAGPHGHSEWSKALPLPGWSDNSEDGEGWRIAGPRKRKPFTRQKHQPQRTTEFSDMDDMTVTWNIMDARHLHTNQYIVRVPPDIWVDRQRMHRSPWGELGQPQSFGKWVHVESDVEIPFSDIQIVVSHHANKRGDNITTYRYNDPVHHMDLDYPFDSSDVLWWEMHGAVNASMQVV